MVVISKSAKTFTDINKISENTVPDSPGIYFFRLKDNSPFNTFENDSLEFSISVKI